MGRITSSVGLISGIPIQQTVDQLIGIQARPRDLLTNLNKRLDQQRTAITQITAQLIAVQLSATHLGAETIYQERVAASQDPKLLAASIDGRPETGQFQFIPLRQASSQQFQSSRLGSADQPLGTGKFAFRFGGFVDQGVSLDELNAGAGFQPGKIRITDRSGAVAEIDLRLARTVDDVLAAVNDNSSIAVRLETVNDRFRLVDESGATAANLRVEEIGGGTAASLGLAGINAAASSADGQTILQLFDDLALRRLNDGRGLRLDDALPDLRVRLKDGSRVTLDFAKLASPGTKARATTTAANGVNASIAFTAVTAGPDFGNVAVSFIDDPQIAAGSETVTYDAALKKLIFRIDAGATTADQVIAALSRDPNASQVFVAARGIGGDGTGLVAASDAALTGPPQATALTTAIEPNARLKFTAQTPGPAFDDVEITFVDNPAVTVGTEFGLYDDSNPLNKRLTFQVDAGNTTANDIIAAVARDPALTSLFQVANAPESSGAGAIDINAVSYTGGGALVAASPKSSETTLKQFLDVVNQAAPGKLQASLGANNRLVLTDLTGGGGFLQIEPLNGSQLLADLGFDSFTAGATLTSQRIYGGLKSSLVRSLGGRAGLGTLGSLALTDRSGATATVNLASAETLDEILSTINNVGLGIRASIDQARLGIVLTDTTGSTAGNLIVANADATNTADRLALAVNAAVSSKSGGNLKLQSVGEGTLLSQFNGGAGVGSGSLKITDNAGRSATLTVDDKLQTVADLIDAIDRLGLQIDARVNDAGDGLLLVDLVGSGASLKVESLSGSSAADLRLLGGAKTIDIVGVPTQVIDGAATLEVTLDADDTLRDLVAKINDLGLPARASLLNDGSTVKPFRFNLFNRHTGSAGQLAVDTSSLGFTLTETVRAKDALLQIGGDGGPIASSSTNEFKNIVPDLTLNVTGASATPVTINVTSTDAKLVSTVKEFVDGYNKLRERLADLTEFNPDTKTAAVLQGDPRVILVEADLNRLVSARTFGAGTFQSLERLGVSVEKDGKLRLDETQLKQQFADNPAAVKDYFSKQDTGLAGRLNKLIDQLAGEGESVLVNRAAVLTRKIEQNQQRIDFMNARLDQSRERLLASFYRSERVIAKLQEGLSALASISSLAANSNNNSNR